MNVWEGAIPEGTWARPPDPDQLSYQADERTYADFTLAGPPAEPVTIGGSVTGLEGSGLVLQNNGANCELGSGHGERLVIKDVG